MSWKQNTAVPVIVGTPSGSEPAGYLVYDPNANIMYISEGDGDFAGWEIDVFHMIAVLGGGTATMSGVGTTDYTENWPYTGSGAIASSGDVTASIDTKHEVYAASGGMTLSGDGTASIDTKHEAYTGSGTRSFYGTAPSEKENA